jgi:hypothetical protein
MTNQYYKKLDCPKYTEINQDLIDYVHKYTTLVTKSNDYRYCNFPDRFGQSVIHFVNANPKLIAWIESMKLILRDVYFTLAWDVKCEECLESSCPIHVDKPPVYWKLNWPIINMERTCVRFYLPKDPDIDINTLVTRSGDPDSKDNDNYRFNYRDFYEVERHDFEKNEPILMNGQIAHDVGFYQNPVFPRIGMQVMFFKEPMHLL